MDFGRRSSLGSLLSAVLVGLLALASNQYARLDPRALRDLLDRWQPRPQVRTDTAPPHDAPASVRQQAEQLESCLFTLLGKRKTHSLDGEHAQTQAILNQVEGFSRQLEQHVELWAAMLPQDQLAIMRVLFMATELDAQRFEARFTSWSTRLTQSSDVVVASQAAALRFFHANNLTQPSAAHILDGLRQFSEQFPDPDLGAHLYVNVANELAATGHITIARRVVQQGANRYAGHASVTLLINWLIDHKS